ncbi:MULTISPECIES: alpha/beta hydrolase [Planococcus]|uniref:Alpha/beta hydrolase n=1 Tax=Planococcus faecalis TaxID=1598147 RepID=A0ABM6INJ7_9BACL|nr:MULTISPECIES: alpha/beta hydrolase [Planococcus]AQU77820.1 alpha/beta hydrolase [Planococcus faecalis]MDJ0333505.1 alpha/beta hydrolase [Planococcus sp. S3-L1]OHX54606.1 alpha/beta hydrolase [Planococcus faecalis]
MENLSFQIIETNGIHLHIAVAGPANGPLVVLLHGFPEFWFGWKNQIQPLAEKGYRVVAPDQRGYNLSDKPKGIDNYTVDYLRDDVIGIIEHFQKKTAIIIGHDWGGAVAWHLAATRPEYVEKLIVLNIPHPKAMPKVLKKNPLQWMKSAYIAFFQLPNLPEKALGMGGFKAMQQGIEQSSKPTAFSKHELELYKAAWSQSDALTAMLNWYRAIRRGSFRQVPDTKIKVPVRIIWGVGDQFLSPMLAKESMSFCEEVNLAFVGEATHWIQHEQPEIVNHLIVQFINE